MSAKTAGIVARLERGAGELADDEFDALLNEAMAMHLQIHTDAHGAERRMLQAMATRDADPAALEEAERWAARWATLAADASILITGVRRACDARAERGRFSR